MSHGVGGIETRKMEMDESDDDDEGQNFYKLSDGVTS